MSTRKIRDERTANILTVAAWKSHGRVYSATVRTDGDVIIGPLGVAMLMGSPGTDSWAVWEDYVGPDQPGAGIGDSLIHNIDYDGAVRLVSVGAWR